MENKLVYGIIAVILGILIMVFPFASNFVLSAIFGIAFIILGIYYLAVSPHTWNISKATSAGYIILGILALICGYILFFNILVFDEFISIYLFVFGFMLIISGIIRLFQKGYKKAPAILNIILGIITIFLGIYAMMSPIYVAIIIGVALIVDGFGLIIGEY